MKTECWTGTRENGDNLFGMEAFWRKPQVNACTLPWGRRGLCSMEEEIPRAAQVYRIAGHPSSEP